MFPVKLDYKSLRIFGCACWPNLHPFNERKLQFRSKRCVFLGYSDKHKGFKCFNVSVGHIYISWDVVFDESVTPFSSLHPNASSHLRDEIELLPSHLYTGHDRGCIVDNTAEATDYSNPIVWEIFVESGHEKQGRIGCSGACDIKGDTTIQCMEHEDALGASVGSVLDTVPDRTWILRSCGKWMTTGILLWVRSPGWLASDLLQPWW
jgi:hypothetical protein